MSNIYIKPPHKRFYPNGFRYKDEYMKAIFFALVNAPLGKQSLFANKAVLILCSERNFSFEEKILSDVFNYEDKIDAAAIGAMAYLALNYKNEDVKNKCLSDLEKVKVHFNNKYL